MAVVSWKNAVAGTWDGSDGTVWDTGTVPGASDFAFLSISGTYTVTLATNASISGLGVGNTGGVITLDFDSVVGRDLNVKGLVLANDGVITLGHADSQELIADIQILSNGAINMGASAASTVRTSGANGLDMASGTINMSNAGDILDAFFGGIEFKGGGLINGQNLIQGAISGTGGTIAVGSGLSVTVTGEITGSNTLQIGAGGVMSVSDASIGATNLTFAGATGRIQFNGATDLTTTGTVTGMVVGTGKNTETTVLDFSALDVKSASFNDVTDILTIVDAADDSVMSLQLADYGAGTFANWDTTTDHVFLTDAVCYAAGTRILTDRGEVSVEELAPGDRVVTKDGETRGLLPVTWIGTRRIHLASHPSPDQVAPIRIARGAFSENVPARDLLVSPPHAILVGDRLIPAKLLVNDMTITRERGMREVTYFHVELERHAIILAEGLSAESYLDTGNRTFFSNAAVASLAAPVFHVDDATHIWQDQACKPLEVSPDAVRPHWEALADRAISLGHVRSAVLTTTDPDLHLLVDGRRIDAVEIAGRTFRFFLPRSARDVRLASRATVPSQVQGWVDDSRSLGIALRGLTIQAASGERQVLSPDNPAFGEGWHSAERQGSALWRWTNGQGVVPVAGRDEVRILEVQVADTTVYAIQPALTGCLAA